jgi:hypothetical protein
MKSIWRRKAYQIAIARAIARSCRAFIDENQLTHACASHSANRRLWRERWAKQTGNMRHYVTQTFA